MISRFCSELIPLQYTFFRHEKQMVTWHDLGHRLFWRCCTGGIAEDYGLQGAGGFGHSQSTTDLIEATYEFLAGGFKYFLNFHTYFNGCFWFP